MKEYIRIGNIDDLKYLLKIIFHMWDVRNNYPKNDEETIYPICRKEEDVAEHVLDCEVAFEKGKHIIGSSNMNHWNRVAARP